MRDTTKSSSRELYPQNIPQRAILELEKLKKQHDELEARIRQNEKDFHTLVDESLLGILITGKSGVLFANQSFSNFSGFSLGELLKMPPEMVPTFIHPDDFDRTKKLFRAHLKGKLPPDSYEFRALRKDGSDCWVKAFVKHVTYQKKPAVQIIFIDITEKKEAFSAYDLRLRYEEGLTGCSRFLLTRKKDALLNVLKSLQKASDACRVYIFENTRNKHGQLAAKPVVHFCAPGVPAWFEETRFSSVPYKNTFQDWQKKLEKGDPVHGFAENFSAKERKLLERQDVRSLLILPIFVRTGWFGFIGFDDTKTSRIWHQEDIQLLRSAAEMLGIYFEHQRMDSKLSESEERFRALVETTTDWIWETDQQGRYTYSSPKAEEWLGYEPEELLGKIPFDLMPQEEIERLREPFTYLLQSQQPFERVNHVKQHKNGGLVTLETSAIPVFNNQQKFIGFRGIDRDITPSKKIQEELAQSEEKFQRFFNSAPALCSIATIKGGKFANVNQAFERITGYSREEAFGKTPVEMGMITETELLRFRQLAGKYQGKFIDEDFKIIAKSGKEKVLLFAVDIIYIDGTPHSLVTALDITDRKKAEKAYARRLEYEKGVSLCSQTLLNNKENSIRNALKHLLQASDVSRVYIFENFYDPQDGLCMKQTAEACAEGVQPEIDNKELQHLPYNPGFFRWQDKLSKGSPVQGLVADFPQNEKDILIPQNILSILVLPVFVKQSWFGFIGFDDTHTKRIWNQDDIRLLETAAQMIGTFFERQQAEAARLESEKRFEDMVANVPGLVFQFALGKNGEEKFTFVNNQSREYGLLPDKIIENPSILYDLIHREDFKSFIASVKHTRKTLERWEWTGRLALPDGTRWLKGVSTPRISTNGNTYWDGLLFDVTAIKETENLLRIQRDVSIDITSGVSLSEALDKVLEAALQLDGIDAGSIYLFDRQTNAYLLTVSKGLSPDFIKMARAIKPGTIEHSVVASGKTFHLKSSLAVGSVKKWHALENIISFSSIPIQSNREIVATINLASRTKENIPKVIQRAMEALAAQTGGIVARAQAEQALRESEKLLRQITDNMLDVVVMLDLEGKYVFISRSFERLFGFDPKKILGTPYKDMIHPDHRERATKAVEKALTDLTPGHFEYLHKCVDGSYIWVETAGDFIYDENKNPVGAVFATRNLSDRKKAEEEIRLFKTMTDLGGEGKAIADQDGKTIYVNKAFAQMHGYEIEECIGKIYTSFHPQKERNRCKQLAYKLMHEGGYGPEDIINIRKNGSSFPVLTYGRPLKDEKEQVLFYTTTVIDVSEKKELEAQLSQAQKMEAIGTLAGGIAHDFNNILGVIVGHSELIQMFNTDPSQSYMKNVGKILEAAYRARDLVDQILTFSRQTEKKKYPLDLSPLVKESVKFLRSSLPVTIKIQKKIKNKSLTVLADPTQMHQVMMNLCINARQAMDDKGGILEIGLKDIYLNPADASGYTELRPGAYAKLWIKDTGCGMEKEILERIFDPFFTTKPADKGTGMGLSVVHGIVKSHKGMIRVESTPNLGSLFEIFLPLMEAEIAKNDDVQDRKIQGGNECILFVDDEQNLVDLGTAILEHFGYQVIHSTSSLDALEMFRSDPKQFDLVITDQTMPDLTGTEMAQELISLKPELPVILCTGFSESVDKIKARKIGIREFILKPLGARIMGETVRKVLDRAKNK